MIDGRYGSAGRCQINQDNGAKLSLLVIQWKQLLYQGTVVQCYEQAEEVPGEKFYSCTVLQLYICTVV